MSRESIDILLSTDNKFACYTSVAMLSILVNTKASISFYIMGNLEDRVKDRLNKIKRIRHCDITYVNVDKALCAPFEKVKIHKHLNISTFFRLLAPQLLSNKNKMLYIDSDVICVRDIALFCGEDLSGFMFAGVEDVDAETLKKSISIPKKYSYINAGVMLMDFKALRDMTIYNKMIEFINNNLDKLPAADQDVINGCFYDKIKLISYRYNMYHEFHQCRKTFIPSDPKDYEESVKDPIIIHFVGAGKPWFAPSNHPYKKEFWEYAKKSPFYDEILHRSFVFQNGKPASKLSMWKYKLMSKITFGKKRKKYKQKYKEVRTIFRNNPATC